MVFGSASPDTLCLDSMVVTGWALWLPCLVRFEIILRPSRSWVTLAQIVPF